LKYAALSALAGVGIYLLVAEETGDGPLQLQQVLLMLLLGHICFVNGLITVLFNLGLGMGMLGKDPGTGAVPLWSYFLFLGFHGPTWLYTRLHQLKDKRFRVAVANEVEPGWWVGGRYAAELGRCWSGTVDLTCEFPEGCAGKTERYLLLPCWDGAPPPPEAIERAANFAVSAREEGDVMVHCAHGRGRSTTVMCACLVKAGLYSSWEAAFEAIKRQRHVVKLNRGMKAVLARWQAEYAATTPERAAAEVPACGGEAPSWTLRMLRRTPGLQRFLTGLQQVKEK